MAYASAEGGYGASAPSVLHLDASHADYVRVPDTELLFHGELRRAGPDLVLTGHDGHRHIISGYFSGEKHPALVAPNGARLSADLVDLLAGSSAPRQYAQAQSTMPSDAVGKVEKVVGTATVIRNGTSVALQVGDAVYKSDLIQTGSSSSVGIAFPDGTALNLVANTRMALSDYAYDPNGTSNSAAFSIIEGTFAFIAGKVAHTGDMRIATPVATMGIRGTIGTAQQISDATWSFAVDDGVYVLIDENGNVIERVYRIGYHTLVHRESHGTLQVTTAPMTPAEQQLVQEIVRDVIQTLNLQNNPNPQSNPNPGSSTPPDQIEHFQLLIQQNGPPIIVNYAPFNPPGQQFAPSIEFGAPHVPPPPPQTKLSFTPSNIVIWTFPSSGPWEQSADWNSNTVPGAKNTVEIFEQVSGQPLTVTLDQPATVNNLIIGPGVTLDIVSGGLLTVLNGLDDSGTIVTSGDPPLLSIGGPVTVESGAKIVTRGGVISFADGTVTIDPAGSGEPAGRIVARGHGAEIDFTSETVDNYGVLAATHHGKMAFEGGTVNNYAVIVAKDWGTIAFGDLPGNPLAVTNNSGAAIVAKDHGIISFDGVNVINDQHAVIEADGGIIRFVETPGAGEPGGITNNGLIAATDCGIVVFADIGADDNGGLFNNGTIAAFGRGSTVDFYDSVINGGTLKADGGTIFVSCDSEIVGPINVVITDGGLADFADQLGALGPVDITFGAGGAPGAGTLELQRAPASDVKIADFGSGDTIDLANLRFSFREHVVWNQASGTLSIYDGCTLEETLHLVGTYSQSDFVLVGDPAGGTEVVYADNAKSSGAWDAGYTWSSGVPGAPDTAVIDRPWTVTLDSQEKIENLVIGVCATLDIVDGGWLKILNTLDDSGLIRIDSTSYDPKLQVDGPTNVTGTGEILALGRYATVAFDHDYLRNAGAIAAGQHGTVIFDHSHVDNRGEIGTGPDGTIFIDHSAIQNACGIIDASGCHASIVLENAIIIGGVLETRGGGLVESPTGATLVDVTLAGGNFETNDGASLNLRGTTTIAETVTFEGGGTFTLAGADAKIVGTWDCDATLDNFGTIAGAGQIGNDHLILDNEAGGKDWNHGSGTIDADVSGRTLTLDTGCHAIINAGTLEASRSGILDVRSDVDNWNGSILVEAHSKAEFAGNVHGGNATVEGGTLEFDAKSNTDVTFDNGGGHYGELILGADSHFTGKIFGFAGTASGSPSLTNTDEIDLVDFADGTITKEFIFGDEVTLKLKDAGGQTISLTFVGPSGTLQVESDGHGGTTIYDPTTTAPLASGSGSSFTVTENFAPVLIGAPGNDNFVFRPDMGVDAAGDFHPHADTIDHFDHIQWAQHLSSLITPDPQGDAVFEPGHCHGASPDLTANYLHAHLQYLAHLH